MSMYEWTRQIYNYSEPQLGGLKDCDEYNVFIYLFIYFGIET